MKFLLILLRLVLAISLFASIVLCADPACASDNEEMGCESSECSPVHSQNEEGGKASDATSRICLCLGQPLSAPTDLSFTVTPPRCGVNASSPARLLFTPDRPLLRPPIS